MSSNPGITGRVPVGPDLIKRSQEGDSDAFAAVFHAHKARIYSLCLRMTSNVAEAEDLTQSAFMQVFRKIATFRGDAAFATWLHRITVNTVLQHFRKKGLCQISLDEPYSNRDGEMVRREIETVDSSVADCVDRIALARAMKDLPHGYRKIFLLHEVQGYEHHEIAEMLGCSIGNSKSQLHRARQRIRKLLAHPSQSARRAMPVLRSPES
jgi:RNA polymerase sigma-70 factor (ECF subfamily)